jgi:hypothetical protein
LTRDPGDPRLVAQWTFPNPILEDWGVVVGEVVYNLRAGLDYLVHALAEHDSGVVQQNTQFPICDDPNAFTKVAKSRLRGIAHSNVSRIESYQPYKGGQWVRELRELSNPDKHRRITAVAGTGKFEWNFGIKLRKTAEGRLVPASDEMKLEVDFSSWSIHFQSGGPVIDTLERLCEAVRSVIYDFRDVLPDQ